MKNENGALWGLTIPCVLVFPGVAWASTETAGAASTGPDLSGVGRALGLSLIHI